MEKQHAHLAALLTLPFILVVLPILGWYVGKGLDHLFTSAPYLRYLFLVFGIVAAVRECYRVIKECTKEE